MTLTDDIVEKYANNGESDGIECSLGKCRMIIGEICHQKATAAVKNICVVKSNTWWYTIRNRRCILWQQKLQM